MIRRVLAIAWLTGVLAFAPSSSAEIYRWTDARGRAHYTQNLDDVPQAQRDAAQAHAQRPSPVQTYSVGSTAPSRRSGRSRRVSRGALRIPFEKRGNAMVVEVRVNDRVTAPFLVDTGASDVAIPAWVADRAGIRVGPDTPRATYLTANGQVSKPVVVLDSVETGEARVEAVRASISNSMDVGLLGGTFFNNFTFQVDPAAGVITAFANDRVRSGLSEQQWRERFLALRQRMEELELYMSENHFARESRVAELERSRDSLREALDALDAEADAADVPRGWRE